MTSKTVEHSRHLPHGERRYADFDERFPPFEPHLIGNMQLEAAFLSAVRATAQEVPLIIDALIERGWAYPERIGISGRSFGGFVTYAAVVTDKRIQVAAPVLGSPEWKRLDVTIQKGQEKAGRTG